MNLEKERKLATAIKGLEDNIGAIAELFGGDVELCGYVVDELDSLLLDMLYEKGVPLHPEHPFAYYSGEITFDELVEEGLKNAKEIEDMAVKELVEWLE